MSSKFFAVDSRLQLELEAVIEDAQAAFPQLAPNQIAVTWITYEPPYLVNTGGALSAEEFWQHRPNGASYRGVELVDPAGLVKLFYLVAAHVWLEQGMMQTSLETERAIADTIVEPGHDAVSYIVDVLSGTTSGPAIPAGPFETWKSQRNIVNRYFAQLGWPELRAVNMNQKIWSDGPYGRERDFLGEAFENRNLLTTEAIARLFHSIVGGVSVTGARSQTMMKLLSKSLNPATHSANLDNQTIGFIGTGLPPTAKIWSKSGMSSQVRHDAAYIESERTHPYLLVVFTEGLENSQDEALIPFVSKRIFEASQQIFQADRPAKAVS